MGRWYSYQLSNTGAGANTAAIAGGVCGGIAVVIVILLWYFCCNRGDCGGSCTCCPVPEWCPPGDCSCCPCCDPEDPPKPPGGGSGAGFNPNRVSGVTAYNNEPERSQPGGGKSVKHDTNNPGGDMYAMVDKGGRGDPDYPDVGRNGKEKQADSQLTYADLDLSSRKEVHIPKDEKEVVVYSSIVV